MILVSAFFTDFTSEVERNKTKLAAMNNRYFLKTILFEVKTDNR